MPNIKTSLFSSIFPQVKYSTYVKSNFGWDSPLSLLSKIFEVNLCHISTIFSPTFKTPKSFWIIILVYLIYCGVLNQGIFGILSWLEPEYIWYRLWRIGFQCQLIPIIVMPRWLSLSFPYKDKDKDKVPTPPFNTFSLCRFWYPFEVFSEKLSWKVWCPGSTFGPDNLVCRNTFPRLGINWDTWHHIPRQDQR